MRTVLLVCLATVSCATTEPIAVATPPPGPTRMHAVAFNPAAFAKEQLSPSECEKAARELRQTQPNDAWAALVACAQRDRWPRGEFTVLDRVTGGFWDDDLQRRPDAPWLIARMIAQRGGDVEGDILVAQKSRVPIFTLAAALRQPDVYKGRWVIVRGSLEDLKSNGSGTAAMLHETSLRNTVRDVDVGGYSYSSSSSANARGSGEGSSNSSRNGNESYSGSGSGSYTSSSSSTYSITKKKFENEKVETGRLVLGKMPEADPFLEPGKEFIFLARFDGLRPSNETDNKPVAVMNISAYYKPNALLVQ